MALALRFGPEDLLRCRFAVSPLWETTNAVRTLAEPQRHGYHLPWLRQVQPELPHLELAPLLAVQPRHGYTPDFLTPPPQSPLVTIDQELERVRSTPVDEVALELGRSLAQREGPPPAALRALLADPAAAPRRLSELLERCWQLLLAPWWERIRDLLDGDIAFRARRLADGGLERLFADLDPSIRFHGDTLEVGGRGEGHRDLAGEGLILMPSAFVWPGVVLVLDLPWQPTLIYPAGGIAGLWQPPAAQPPVARPPAGPHPRQAPARPRRAGLHHHPGPPLRPEPQRGLRTPVGLARRRPAHLLPRRSPGRLRAHAPRHRPGRSGRGCGRRRPGQVSVNLASLA
jgi:Family of unknown function (DUF5937)